MSLFRGGGSKVKPSYTGLQVQTSSSTIPIPLVWGANRLAPNIIWYGDFTAVKQQQKSGKGAPKIESYTYTASVEFALCYGPISGVGKAWKDNSTTVDFATLGFTLLLGTDPQAPWSFLTSNHPSEALGYIRTAILAQANYDLGTGATLGSHTFEALGFRYQSQVGGTLDADPALIVQDFLTADFYSVGIPLTAVDTDTLLSSGSAPTPGDSAFQTYCQAIGFGLSPVLDSQESGLVIIERWMKLTNTAVFWPGYALKFVPYGDEEITGNGVTYLPPLTVRYDLNDTHYQLEEGSDPVICSRSDPADAHNQVKIEICDRNNNYNNAPVTLDDLNAVRLYGLRPASSITAHEVTEHTMASKMVQLLLQREVYIRNKYTFTLSWEFCLLEPMDVVTLTDSVLGLNLTPVRVLELSEDDDGKFKVIAEQLTIGISAGPGFGTASVTNTPQNSLNLPGDVNPPMIIEPPSSLTNGIAEIWIAISGGNGTVYNPNWGGAQVWLSLDGTTYKMVGSQETAARQGKLTAILAGYGGANPDTVHTLAVDLQMSNGELTSGIAADMINGVTLCAVEGELLSFQTATLTGTNAYNLTTMYRGRSGTAAVSHAIGANFARLDNNIFKYQLPPEYIGQTVYVKLASFNVWGQQVQDLASVTAYTYVPVGTGFGGGSGGVPSTPTGLTGTPGAQSGSLSWNFNPSTDNVTTYKLYEAPGTGALFGSAVLIWSGLSANDLVTGLGVATGYTFFVVAHNMVGDSLPSSGFNLTTTPAPAGASTVQAIASETLTAGMYVSIWDDSGVAKVRKVQVTDDTKTVDGFIKAGYSIGQTADIYLIGSVNDHLTGLTPGLLCWAAANGGITQTLPTTGWRQEVGKSVSASQVPFNPSDGDLL